MCNDEFDCNRKNQISTNNMLLSLLLFRIIISFWYHLNVKSTSLLPHGDDVKIENNQKLLLDRNKIFRLSNLSSFHIFDVGVFYVPANLHRAPFFMCHLGTSAKDLRVLSIRSITHATASF